MSDTSNRPIDPARLALALENAGWEVAGGRPESYTRLRPRDNSRSTLLIPLDKTAADFDELMTAAVNEVASTYPELWVRSILPRVSAMLADAFRFTKETAAPAGLITWKGGEELVDSSRATLIAGAKANREPRRYFGNKFGQFASRYLDEILMGQTAVGSYVVTAFIPVDAKVPISTSAQDSFEYENVDVAFGRAVTQSVVKALEATTEALLHFRETTSMSGFEAGIDSGISYDLVTAVKAIAANSDGAEIAIQWEPAEGSTRVAETTTFEFAPSDAPVLERAAGSLASPPEKVSHVARGRVHLLTKKEASGPGVVGVDDGKHKFRVRLRSEEQYHEAVLAHDEDREVQVSGELSREGNINWIYDATLRRPPERQAPHEAASTLFESGA